MKITSCGKYCISVLYKCMQSDKFILVSFGCQIIDPSYIIQKHGYAIRACSLCLIMNGKFSLLSTVIIRKQQTFNLLHKVVHQILAF